MRKRIAFILSCILAVTALGACKKKDETVLKINEVTHSVFYAPLYLAEGLGYFEEENIKIELTNGGGADAVTSAVLSGDADVGFCGPEACVYVALGGSKDAPVVFGQLTKRDGSLLVSRTPEPNFKWTDLKDKEILAGRKGGVPAMTFEYVLNKNGLTNGVDVTLNFDVAFNLMTGAFEAGTADYCTMFEPTATEYEKAGKGYVVASVGEASGEVPYTCFTAKKSWLTKNQNKAEGLLRAVTKAVKYIRETPKKEVAKYLLPYFDGLTEETAISVLTRYTEIDAWVTDMAMTKESYNRLLDIIENAGELEKRVEFESVVDNSTAEKIYKEVYNG